MCVFLWSLRHSEDPDKSRYNHENRATSHGGVCDRRVVFYGSVALQTFSSKNLSEPNQQHTLSLHTVLNTLLSLKVLRKFITYFSFFVPCFVVKLFSDSRRFFLRRINFSSTPTQRRKEQSQTNSAFQKSRLTFVLWIKTPLSSSFSSCLWLSFFAILLYIFPTTITPHFFPIQEQTRLR